MFLYTLFGATPREAIIQLLLTAPIIIIALSAHEAAHGYIAYKMGDRTAFNLGRVTLNPVKHIDPIGAIAMLLFGYGWAKPVPINPRNFDNPKKGMALTGLAGPVTNIILGLIGSMFFCLTYHLAFRFPPESQFTLNLVTIALLFFRLWVGYNFIFAVFDLIPVPPFDGSRFATVFLPTKWYFGIMRYERYILIGILAGCFLLDFVLGINIFSSIANRLFQWSTIPFDALFGLII